jgi:hypothetical protein
MAEETQQNFLNEPLINFTDEEFKGLMRERGLEGIVQGVVSSAQEDLGNDIISYESLKSGTAPLLDMLPVYQNIPPEKRQLGDEEILTLFTNVEDFGKYSRQGEDVSLGFEAFKEGAFRQTPETIGGGLGFTFGVTRAMPIANLIPPLGFPGLIAKGVVLGVGGITGAVMGAWGASEAEDLALGEQSPVVPSLQSARNWGEGTMLGLSLLHAPWLLPTKTSSLTKNAEFLENFKNVATGKFASTIKDASELTAKNAGLSEKAFKLAQEAAENRAKFGTMFGEGAQINLGITRFNPAGFLFDPAKGPIAERLGQTVSSGVRGSLQAAREKPGRFMVVETGAALGAGFLGDVVAKDPYDEMGRFYGELIGAALVPLPAQFAVDHGPRVLTSIKDRVLAMGRAVGGKQQGLAEGKLKQQGAERLLRALRLSDEYDPKTGETQLELFIEGLLSDDTPFTAPSDTALRSPLMDQTAATYASLKKLPFQRSLETIERELGKQSKDLEASSRKGKEQLIQRAKFLIDTFIATGDPAAIQTAARMQQALYEETISGQVSGALQNLFDASKQVLKDEPLSENKSIEMGEKVFDIMSKQIEQSKFKERQLWNEVGNLEITSFRDKNGNALDQPNFITLLDTPVTQSTPFGNGLQFSSLGGQSEFNQALGGVKKDIDNIKKFFSPETQTETGLRQEVFGDTMEENPVTSQKLFEMRSLLLDRASLLRVSGQKQLATKLDKLSDAILQDLVGADEGDQAYNVARAYTFARNNVFTRSFYGELQSYSKDRSAKFNPQSMNREFFKGGMDKTVHRIREINDAIKFGVDHGLDPDVFNRLDTNSAIDLLVRSSLRKFIKPSTKNILGEEKQVMEISEAGLKTWRNQPGTKELFSVFPTLEVDTRTVAKAQRLLDAEIKDVTSGSISPDVSAFQVVLQFQEKPGEAVANAVKGERPESALMELYKLATKEKTIVHPIDQTKYTSEQAVEGLKGSILTYAASQSGGQGLNFSPTSFYDRLFTRLPNMDPKKDFSLASFMQKNNIMSKEHLDEMREAIGEMRGIEQAVHSGKMEEALFRDMNGFSLLQARIMGATAGVKAQKFFNDMLEKIGLGSTGGIGGGLIAAEAGSEAVVQFLLRGPETKRQKLMIEMLSDRKMLGEMLEKIKNKQDAQNSFEKLEEGLGGLSRQVGRRLPYTLPLIQDDEVSFEEPVVEEETIDTSAVVPEPRVSPVQTPNPLLISQNLPQARPQPAAASGPVDRTKYAALFPNDMASSMIKGGIGGLMG